MPFNILLLPLLGGFIFIHWWNRTKFKAIRLDKERLLFYASLAGLGLLALSFLLTTLIPPFIPCVTWLPCIPTLPFEYISQSTLALLLGLMLPLLLNRIWKYDEESARYVEEEGDPFEQLINRSLTDAKPVMLTLKGGKVYVGFIVSSFAPAREQKTIQIAPIKSGYRESAKQRVNFTTDYSEALEKMTVDLGKLIEQKGEAEEKLRLLQEAYGSKEKEREALAEAGEKNEKALSKLKDEIAVSESQIGHLERVVQSQTDAIETLASALDDFGIVIPIGEVTASTLYSAQVHADYFAHKDPE